jgi:hypothetical protein
VFTSNPGIPEKIRHMSRADKTEQASSAAASSVVRGWRGKHGWAVGFMEFGNMLEVGLQNALVIGHREEEVY